MQLPSVFTDLLTTADTPEALFFGLMPALGKFLACDRCFLYLREPETRWGRAPFYWVRGAAIPVVYDSVWKLEPDNLAEQDPMFAAALRTEPSLYIDDVETTSPQILNQQFERENFGHRALIHAHLCHEGQLWGVLQPCVLDRPRVWTKDERQVIEQLLAAIVPAAVEYVKAARLEPVN